MDALIINSPYFLILSATAADARVKVAVEELADLIRAELPGLRPEKIYEVVNSLTSSAAQTEAAVSSAPMPRETNPLNPK